MTDPTPVFFLSHARTPGSHRADADRPVFSFFEELREQVARLTDVSTRQLRELLETTLSRHRHLRDMPPTARGTAARGIPKADAFAWLFAELAKSCYLRYLESRVRRPTSD
jgi:hypothetical protein